MHKGSENEPSYGEVAEQLRQLGQRATSPEAREQLAALAAMFEKLGVQAAKLAEAYPAPMREPGSSGQAIKG